MKIAMITPGFLPVPATKGGAVECLITQLLDCNEHMPDSTIDLYTIPDSGRKTNHYYRHTNIIPVNIKRTTKFYNAFMNKMYVFFHINKWNTSYARTVKKYIKNKEYDYVIIHNNLIAFREIYRTLSRRNKMVYVLHNDIPDGKNERILAGMIGEKAYKILAVSQHTKKHFETITPNDKTRVLYNCLDKEAYLRQYSDEKISELRTKIGLKKDDFVFMYSGRLDIYKGVLELIHAFEKLENKKSKLLIVGKSWFDSEKTDAYTKQLIEASKPLKDRVIFTGFVEPERMPQTYRLADVLVVPSLWEEPFGMVAIEGMAASLPLIVTDSGGLLEIVTEDNAIIVKRDDIENNLTEAMAKLLKDKRLCTKMGQVSRRIIERSDKYDSKKYLENLLKELDS